MYLWEKAQGNTGQPKTDYADRKRIGGKSQKPQRKAAHRREKSGKIIKGSRKGEKNGLKVARPMTCLVMSRRLLNNRKYELSNERNQ